MTWAYEVFSDWLVKKEQQRRKTVSRKFFLSTCISIVRLLPVSCMFCVYVYIAYCFCLHEYFLFLLLNAFLPIACWVLFLPIVCRVLPVGRWMLILPHWVLLLPIVRQVLLLPIVVEFFYYHSHSWPLYSRSHAHPVKYRYCTECHVIFWCNTEIAPDVSWLALQ